MTMQRAFTKSEDLHKFATCTTHKKAIDQKRLLPEYKPTSYYNQELIYSF